MPAPSYSVLRGNTTQRMNMQVDALLAGLTVGETISATTTPLLTAFEATTMPATMPFQLPFVETTLSPPSQASSFTSAPVTYTTPLPAFEPLQVLSTTSVPLSYTAPPPPFEPLQIFSSPFIPYNDNPQLGFEPVQTSSLPFCFFTRPNIFSFFDFASIRTFSSQFFITARPTILHPSPPINPSQPPSSSPSVSIPSNSNPLPQPTPSQPPPPPPQTSKPSALSTRPNAPPKATPTSAPTPPARAPSHVAPTSSPTPSSHENPHKKTAHGEMRVWRCEKCGVACKRRDSLAKHVLMYCKGGMEGKSEEG
ncbi:hypothetical protein BC829DRAFT_489053 [Chytridium lagenaria]|nr:hypothetical protein BC829DRAFT_489053 [Chytridium lagenaria]